MKIHRVLTQRPTPRMPELAGFEPRFDAIPLAAPGVQPPDVVRPLYWWAKDLRRQGYVLGRVHFDVSAMAATVSVRLPSYRVVEVVRRHNDKPRLPHDLPALLAEAVWRLGALGWTDELDELVPLLRNLGLTTPAPRSAVRRTQPIPGWATQPDRAVRVAYWWAVAPQARGGSCTRAASRSRRPVSSLRSPAWTGRRCWRSTRVQCPTTARRLPRWLIILSGSPRASVSSCSGSSPTPRLQRAGWFEMTGAQHVSKVVVRLLL